MLANEKDVYITGQLNARPIGKTNHLQEKQAIQELAQCMVENPEAILPRFTDLAMQITGARAGGLSLLEPNPAPGQFRWRYLSGAAVPHEHGLAPRNFSPCGVTLDQDAPVLTAHPARYYAWIADADMDAAEILLVPLRVSKGPQLGTLWINSNNPGHFHRGHVRALTELSVFVSAALRMIGAERKLERALNESQTLLARTS